MEFGRVLRELLEDNGISQKQLASDLAIAASTVGNYIRDNREPDYKTLKRIADYFNVTVDYILDHHCKQTSCHQEDRLLQIFRSLPPKNRQILLEIGILLLKNEKSDA